MIERVCDQHQFVNLKHSLFFILKKKSLSKTDLPSRSWVNYIFVNTVNQQNLGTFALEVEQFPNRTSKHFFLISIFLRPRLDECFN